jgi:hypothetical protein
VKNREYWRYEIERECAINKPRERSVFLAPAFALTAVLLAGCGSGGGAENGAKVEAGLRDFFATVNPEDTSFPQGAGVVPQVTTNSCKEQHVPPLPKARKKQPLRKKQPPPLWVCVVRFGRAAMPVAVVVDDNNKVVQAMPALSIDRPPPPPLPPARTYTG